MNLIRKAFALDPLISISMVCLMLLSLFVLNSITPEIFPIYYLYIIISIIIFLLFLKIDFDIYLLFSNHLYIFCIFLLILPLIIGQISRGAIRWIPIGPVTIQPSEIVRPFLILFFAKYLTAEELNLVRIVKAIVLVVIPIILILIQPSLGVALITGIALIGVYLASGINKKILIVTFLVIILVSPGLWLLLAPYQKQRVLSFVDPGSDPQGAGYNSIQSMISVGSGRFFGRGLGKGVQTQLQFLPEKHTDFIFAAVSEELGFIGASLLLILLFVLYWRISRIIELSKGRISRAFVAGILLAFFVETIIHIGMNMKLLPITGVPLPFVSAGGSALMASMISLSMVLKAKKVR